MSREVVADGEHLRFFTLEPIFIFVLEILVREMSTVVMLMMVSMVKMVKTSARGSVSQFGEVKVKPLSVPASRGKTCRGITHCPIVLSSFLYVIIFHEKFNHSGWRAHFVMES